MVWRAWSLEAERRAETGEDVPLPPGEPFVLEASVPESVDKRSYRSLEVDGETWTLTFRAVGPEAAECTGRLVAVEAVAVSEALDRVAALSAAGPVCPETASGKTALELRWSGATSGAVTISEGCFRERPALDEIWLILWRLPLAALDRAGVSCS